MKGIDIGAHFLTSSLISYLSLNSWQELVFVRRVQSLKFQCLV